MVQWQNVFYLGGAANVLSLLSFVIFTESKIQPWALKYMVEGTDLQLGKGNDSEMTATFSNGKNIPPTAISGIPNEAFVQGDEKNK